MKKLTLTLAFVLVLTIGIALAPAVYADSQKADIDEKVVLENDTKPSPGSGGSSGESKGGSGGGGGSQTSKPKTEKRSAVIDTRDTHKGNYTKTWIDDNYFLWTFLNTDTKSKTSDKTPGKKYTWTPKETGKYTITSEVNCKYRHHHRQYYEETVYHYEVLWQDWNHYETINSYKTTRTKYKTVYDYEKDEFDSSRTKNWDFTVTADMIGKPVKFPDVFQDVEIPCDYELTL